MRSFFLLAMLCIAGFAMGQVKVSVQTGGNLAKVKTTDEDPRGTLKGITGGIGIDIPLHERLSLLTGLQYIGKGYAYKESGEELGESYKVTVQQRINYLELPLLAAYKFPLGNNYLLAGAGPSIGWALSGTNKSALEFMGETITEEEKIPFGGTNNEQVKRIDWGASILVGFETESGFLARLGYTHGLNNLYNGYQDNGRQANYYNRSINLMIGYYLFK